jgi:phosphatidate cytidylyltransferase
MRTRIIVGLLALPVVLVPLWLGGLWSVALFLAVAVLGGLEFYQLMEAGGYRPSRWLGLAWLLALVLNGRLPDLLPLSSVLTAGLVITLIDALRRHEQPVHTWMSTAMGAIYLGLVLGQVVALRDRPAGLEWIFFGFAITWLGDSGAYFTGVTVGRHKLWPRLSPKKTWEGTIAGIATAGIAGAILAWGLPSMEITPLLGGALGLVCGVLALFGDLSISMIKRQVHVKDSGTLFPGHGGMLDRMDSLLFVMPLLYQVVRFLAE